MKTMYKQVMCDVASVSVTKDAKSPFWLAQWTDARGKRVKRSTKVPVAGGVYRGERLTPVQARKRAEVVAWQFATEREEEYNQHDNTTVRQLFDKMLSGALGRVSVRTYDNARTIYWQFCEWLGKRADEPLRLITRADVQEYVLFKRGGGEVSDCA